MVSHIYFTSWRHVRIGGFNLDEMSSAGAGFGWFCTHGRAYDDSGTPTNAASRIVHEGRVPLEVAENGIRFVAHAPHGVRLVAQPPTRIKFTDRLGLDPTGWPGPLTILADEGKYKCWYTILPPASPMVQPLFGHGGGHHLCYAESADGFNWTKPKLGLVEYDGSRANNILLSPYMPDGRPRGMFGPNVFIDPHGDPAERYKLAYFARFTEDEAAAYAQKYPDTDVMSYAGGYWGRREGPAYGIAGAVSPDGIQWRRLEDPMLIHHSDIIVNASFDAPRGKYVCYLRMWPTPEESPESHGVIGKRSVGRTTSANFRHWAEPEVIINTGADTSPSVLYYGAGHSWLPGCDNQQVMFVNRWLQEDDTMDLSLFSTPDGWAWSRVPGGDPVVGPGQIGTWEGGYIYGGAQLVELPGARWALPYSGYPIGHKYPRLDPAKRKLHSGVATDRGYALWPKGRLVALECPDEGAFATVAVKPAGARLFLNATVEPAGYIKVGLRKLSGGTDRIAASADIPHRTAQDCDVIWGKDDLEIPVAWKGEDNLRADGQPIVVTFQLRRAKLFGLHFR